MIPPTKARLDQAIFPHLHAPTSPRFKNLVAGVLMAALVACADSPEGGEGSAPAEEAATTSASVRIVLPAEGAMVEGGSVLITLEVSGLTIAPAGTMDSGTGHHHLVVDAELPAAGTAIPATPGMYIHMGQGQIQFELTGLEAGEHTVIAVVGDGVHIPLSPFVVDTVRFVVE
jgi:hypothetical protein